MKTSGRRHDRCIADTTGSCDRYRMNGSRLYCELARLGGVERLLLFEDCCTLECSSRPPQLVSRLTAVGRRSESLPVSRQQTSGVRRDRRPRGASAASLRHANGRGPCVRLSGPSTTERRAQWSDRSHRRARGRMVGPARPSEPATTERSGSRGASATLRRCHV